MPELCAEIDRRNASQATPRMVRISRERAEWFVRGFERDVSANDCRFEIQQTAKNIRVECVLPAEPAEVLSRRKLKWWFRVD